jgi:hypothetical protein
VPLALAARYRTIADPKATRDQKGDGKILFDPRPPPGGKRRDKRDRAPGSGTADTKKGFTSRSRTPPRDKASRPQRVRRAPEKAERCPKKGEQDGR